MAESEEGCGLIEVSCKLEGIVGDSLAAVAYDLLDKAAAVLEWLSTRWLHWSPGIDTESNAVAQVQANLWWYTGAIAILGIIIALGKMVLSNDFKTLIGVAKPIVNLIIVTGVYAAGIRLLDDAANELAVWMFEQIESNQGDSVGMAAIGAMILTGQAATTQAIGGALIVGLLAILGSVMLFGFMIFRDVTLLIMLAFIPTVAAATGTETGDQAFKKANGWLLALLLFKPVAAVIIALGITLMQDNTDISGSGDGTLMRPISGVLIVCLASLALPALIKFVVPAAAAGAGAFSGGAALAGAATVAGGAAVIAATGGTGAAAGGAGAATTSGAASTSGAGATTGAGTASASGAAGGEASGAAPTPGGGDGGSGGGGGSPSGGESGSGAKSPGESGAETGTAGAGASESSSSTGGESAAGGGPGGSDSGDTSAGSADGADQADSDSGSGAPTPQPAGGSGGGGGLSGSDMAVMAQALGSGAEQSSDGLDEAAEGA